MWLLWLAYMADIFEHLDDVNTGLHGRKENLLSSTDKLVSLQRKINIQESKIANGSFEMFRIVPTKFGKEMTPLISDHLNTLQRKDWPLLSFTVIWKLWLGESEIGWDNPTRVYQPYLNSLECILLVFNCFLYLKKKINYVSYSASCILIGIGTLQNDISKTVQFTSMVCHLNFQTVEVFFEAKKVENHWPAWRILTHWLPRKC